eukprot:GFUD01030219.1.p1 GENE.GFUD01030219.1~~GFUD01030219.1.p1  ORF type:complete len:765 (-),score=159.24 GFUD01030219.1:331-2625(-)
MNLLPLLLLVYRCSSVFGVVSPLDKVTEELKEMKDTVNSVQASLITSVSLIQDQLNDFTGNFVTSLESKLTSLDTKVTMLNSNLASLSQRAHAWDTFQHHIDAWTSQLTSLDQKIEHLRRSQDEKLLDQTNKVKILPDIDFKLEKFGRKLSDLGGQLQVVDNRLLSLQDSVADQSSTDPLSEITSQGVLSTLNNIESLIKNSTARTHHKRPQYRHSSRHLGSQSKENHLDQVSSCQANHDILQDIQSKVGNIHNHVIQESNHKDIIDAPRFDYLRGDAPSPQIGVYSVDQEEDFSDAEDKFVSLFRKIATPFKRVNKRLMSMETLQDKIETEITDIKVGIENTNGELKRQLSEFIASSTEMSQEQNHLIEGYAANFASLQQCCSGHSADYNRFVAQAGPVVDKMDRWMTSWQNLASQKFDRILQQNSYDHDTINKGQKALESFLMEGFDRCKMRDSRAGKRIRPTPSYSETTTKIPTTTTERVTTPEVIEDNDVLKLPFVDESEILDDDVSFDTKEPYAKMPSGCDDLKHSSGSSSSKVYKVGVSRMYNEGGKDFNTRLCDQETSGGGWTVIQRRGDFGEPKINFTRSWKDYKHGFGDLNGEFWFGNDYISILSANKSVMLRIELEAHDGRRAYAEYSTFRVDSEDLDYRLWLGGYSGNASDSLSAHNGYKFSTVDRNNDQAPKCCPCAPAYGGGWWFYSCFESNLNGEYFLDPDDNGYYRGIIWELWLGDYSLKAAKMMIRPKDFSVGYDPDSRDSLVVPPDP